MFELRTTFPIIWTAAVVAALADVAAHALEWPHPGWVDEALHLLLPLAVTLWLGRWLQRQSAIGQLRPPWLLVLVIAGLGLGLGAVWEIGEWGFELLVPGNAVSGGEVDLITDLILDTGGALAAALLCWRAAPPPPAPAAPDRHRPH